MTSTSNEDESSEANGSVWYRQMLLIGDQEMRLSFKNRWALALTGLITILASFLVIFSGSSLGPSSFSALIVSLTSLGTYLIPLAALVFGYDAIVGSAENGWLNVVFALPVRRSTAVVGTYLGRGMVLAGSTAIAFGIAAFLMVVNLGVFNPAVYGLFLLTSVLLGLSLLSIAFLISTLSSEKTHALGISLLAWLWFVLIHDLVALGIIAAMTLPTEALSALILANPVDIFRVIILESVNARGGGFAEVFATTDLSIPVLFVGLLVWIVGPLLLSSRFIGSRSL
jgi:Cu-processing system permease protein